MSDLATISAIGAERHTHSTPIPMASAVIAGRGFSQSPVRPEHDYQWTQRELSYLHETPAARRERHRRNALAHLHVRLVGV